MSVADVSRKTAAWNEYLANKSTAMDGPLAKGWKTFKEYPDDPRGLKWVEFGPQEQRMGPPGTFTLDTLPEGYVLDKNTLGKYGIAKADERGYRFADRFDTPEEALADLNQKQVKPILPDGWEAVQATGGQTIYKRTSDGKQFYEHPAELDIREGLKAEGDSMGHCVGGYCDDVLNRGTRIYSLRDKKGQPHVTIEVGDTKPDWSNWIRDTWLDSAEPLGQTDIESIVGRIGDDAGKARFMENMTGDSVVGRAPRLAREWAFHQFPEALHSHFSDLAGDAFRPNIVQIKGKQNAAPVADYLPAVQDFVKSGKWGRVGDLRNTGLLEFKGGKTNIRDSAIGPAGHEKYPFGERRVFENVAMPKGYMTAEEASQFLQAQGVPADMANNQVGNYEGAFKTRGYAHGGSVKAPEPDAPKGFLPRNFEQWVEYAEELYANSAQR